MPLKPPPLQFFFLYHPASQTAKDFAARLMDHFVEPPASGGLRIPLRFTPDLGDGSPPGLVGDDRLNLDAAQRTIVVFLADQTMVQAARPIDRGREWKRFHDELKALEEQRRHGAAATKPLHVFVVALDAMGYQLSGDRHAVGGQLCVEQVPQDDRITAEERKRLEAENTRQAEERRLNDVSLQIAIRAIQLLRRDNVADEAPEKMEIPVCLFLSHAKMDLAKDWQQKKLVPDDPVHYVMARLQGLPVQKWFDSEQIRPGSDFAREIDAGLQNSTTVVAFLTDWYASRRWCRHEALLAKQYGLPLLVVDALRQGEVRNFPYLGNAPTVRWSGPYPPPGKTPGAPVALTPADEAAAAVAAMQVIDRAVRETLKSLHNRAVTALDADPGEIVLGAAAEALTLANHPGAGAAGKTVFLYPDPPLASEELSVLRGLRPDAEFLTPFIRRTRQRRPDEKRLIGVSISDSGPAELARNGLLERHQQTLSDEVHLYLLLAGFQIGYGGLVSGDFSQGNNFTLRLFELARGYARLTREAALARGRPIVNFAPWPYRLEYGNREFGLFQLDGIAEEDQYALYEDGPEPNTPSPIDDVFPPLTDAERAAGKYRFKLESSEQRFVLARGLTAMRQLMTQKVAARLLIGGKLSGFHGYHPGVVEEAWMSLTCEQNGKRGRPLFLVGAFGGVARLVIDVLEGRERDEFTEAHALANVPHYGAAPALYQPMGVPFVTRETIRDEIRKIGENGPAAALNNGLDDAQNREMFRATDAARIAELVLEGMSNLQ
jgi:hypothetical protein